MLAKWRKCAILQHGRGAIGAHSTALAARSANHTLEGSSACALLAIVGARGFSGGEGEQALPCTPVVRAALESTTAITKKNME